MNLQIPGYDIEAVLGKGGMATVYRARQQSFGREVALKVLNPSLGDSTDFIHRFMRESAIVGNLHHSHIVQVYDVGQAGEYSYICMEYLSGGHLARQLKAGLTLKQIVAVIRQLASALDYAHRKNIIHRDLKPENVLFREDDAAVLTDFGVAKELQANNNLTQARLMIGTPKYMSPEQFNNTGVDHRSDLYALGVVLYRCLTNTVPFRGKDAATTAYMHSHSPIPRLPESVAGFQPLVNRLLAKDPDKRIQTGAQVLDALEQIAPDVCNWQLTNLDIAAQIKLASGDESENTDNNITPQSRENPTEYGPRSNVTAISQQIARYRSEANSPIYAGEPMAPRNSKSARPTNSPNGRDKKRAAPTAALTAAIIGMIGIGGYAATDRDFFTSTLPQWGQSTRAFISTQTAALNLSDVKDQITSINIPGLFSDVINQGGEESHVSKDTAQRTTPPAPTQADASATQRAPASEPSPRPATIAEEAAAENEKQAPIAAPTPAETPSDETLAQTPTQKETEEREEPLPLPETPSAETVPERIDRLIDSADSILEDSPFSRQANLRALSQYNTVLELDKLNPQATAGVQRVAQRFLAMAEVALNNDQLAEASEYLADARFIDRDLPRARALQRRLSEAQVASFNE